ncbi:MAG: nucleoside-diphosphate sugar epimerase/dehydratase [Planctomycetales bacterium]
MTLSGNDSPRPSKLFASGGNEHGFGEESGLGFSRGPFAPPTRRDPQDAGSDATLRSTLRMLRRLALYLPASLAVYCVCFHFAFLLRFEFVISEANRQKLYAALPSLLAVKLLTLFLTGEWRRTFRYATLSDMVSICGTAVAATLLFFAVNVGLEIGPRVPRSIILIDGILSVPAIGLLRLARRLYTEYLYPLLTNRQKPRAVIYGTDREAIAILRTIKASHPEYRVVGLIDDRCRERFSVIAGIRAYSETLGWPKIAQKLAASHVLIPSTVPGKTVREVLAKCKAAGLRTHVIPAIHELVHGRYQLTMRDVTISDLLRREPAQLDVTRISACVAGKRVLVTGGAGSIGAELCRQLLQLNPASLVVVDRSELGIFNVENEFRARPACEAELHCVVADVACRDSMTRVMEQFRPQLMFHAAAYKHVPLMEHNPRQAIRNNVFGTKLVVDLADRHEVERFVLISTDKAVRPTNVMGATKLVCEKYVQAAAVRSRTQFITVRFGNVLNSAGSVVPTFRRQIAAGGPVTVTHPEIVRFFMTIPEAVQLVLQAAAIGRTGNVLILEMGEPVKIVDLAKDMIYLSGARYPDDVDIVFTGLRPGEKLYEELFYEAEGNSERIHERIFCARCPAPPEARVQRHLARLEQALAGADADARRALAEIVAEYVAADRPADAIKAAA